MTQTTVKGVKMGDNGKKHVSVIFDGMESVIEVDTILVAIGRDPNPMSVRVDLAGVEFNQKSGKILGGNGEVERTNIDHIYAVGDIVDKVPELQTVAAKSGKYLAHRISHRKFQTLDEDVIQKQFKMDYQFIPTTVFSPVEYSYVGMNEEEAIKALGEENIEVYHKESVPL